jgi:hypothetical protein
MLIREADRRPRVDMVGTTSMIQISERWFIGMRARPS